jgi:hypothetical protein
MGWICAASQALPLIAGPNDELIMAEPDPAGGTVLGTPLSLPFSALTFSGTLTTTIIQGDTSNPYGGLTFVYQLTNNAGSPDAIHRLTINGFDSFLTDVSYQALPAVQAPTLMNRSVSGDVIGFGFLGPVLGIGRGALQPGATSTPLVIQTNATAYQQTVASVIDGYTASVGTYSPVVPEPMTLGFMALGFGMALIRRR